MRNYSLRYAVLTARLDQFWFPAAMFALFTLIAVFMRLEGGKVAQVGIAYLGAVLPLVGGVMGAYAVLEDPALELRFATPVTAWSTLIERLGMILCVEVLCALAYQGILAAMGVSLARLGNFGSVQLAWLVPGLWLLCAGCLVALTGRRSAIGALAVGLIWLVELLLRTTMLGSAWARYLLIFMGATNPGAEFLRGNQAALLFSCVGFFIAAWMLLRRQERYL